MSKETSLNNASNAITKAAKMEVDGLLKGVSPNYVGVRSKLFFQALEAVLERTLDEQGAFSLQDFCHRLAGFEPPYELYLLVWAMVRLPFEGAPKYYKMAYNDIVNDAPNNADNLYLFLRARAKYQATLNDKAELDAIKQHYASFLAQFKIELPTQDENEADDVL